MEKKPTNKRKAERKLTTKKIKQIKRFYESSSVLELIKDFKKSKDNFILVYTGYTCLITNTSRNIEYFFIKQNNRASFGVTQKIKSEIKASEVYLDGIPTDKVKYFRLNELTNSSYKNVYNVDINSAYPKALLNLGLISEMLFNELQALPKIKKLKAIGQLATKKSVFEFVAGEQIKFYHKTDEQMRNVWFALCNEVGEAINECKENCNSFLFFWFDGIYFTDKKEAEKLQSILLNRKFESKLEVLKEFTVKDFGSHLEIKYKKKDGNKTFVLPKSENLNYN